MSYDLTPIKNKAAGLKDWLKKEYVGIRTGRAMPALLDSVMTENFGSRQPLKHIAAITVEDARTLRIAPWDKSQIKVIQLAITEANLGVSTAPDEAGVRVIFPELTSDRRTALIKIVKEKLEEAKISLRKERERFWTDIQTKERSGEVSEDDKFRLKDELQKITDGVGRELDQLAAAKESEIKL